MTTDTDTNNTGQPAADGSARAGAGKTGRRGAGGAPGATAVTAGRRVTGRRLASWAAGLAGVLLLVLLPLLNISLPGVLPGPSYTPGSLQLLAMCMLMAAAALTYHLLLGVAGLLSFGHALYFGAGVYGLAIILQNLDIPLLPAMGLTLLIVIVLAHVVGSISLRVSGIPFAMVTLAFAQAGSVIVGRNPEGRTGGDEGLTLRTDNLPDFLVGVVNTRNLYWLALAVLVVVFVVVTWVQSSRAGHSAAAVRENELRVRVLGLQPYLVKLLIFVLSAHPGQRGRHGLPAAAKRCDTAGHLLGSDHHAAGHGGPGRRRLALGRRRRRRVLHHPRPAAHCPRQLRGRQVPAGHPAGTVV
ncbi:branched-chain amino acid ABC transporter permease [Arthrobacter sp. B3I4]|uniref:branched-chain amino acid ABC transporter permease n=1 Tax=Arthrobacter sp. B3I4 TaxID=3042267 RepID=UPI0027877F40|nr:ABC-type branched-subunit amino acid transport system permease subunit [Arthrobacter sp. B3I4]